MNNLLQNKRLQIVNAQEEARVANKQFSPNSKLVKEYKALLPHFLPFVLLLVGIGNMLGDCSIRRSPSTGDVALKFEWGNKAYAYFIYGLFYDYVLTPPREQVRTNASGNKVTTYCFQTLSHSSFTILYHLFMVNGKKTVPTGLVRHFVTPLTLAIWYMDDGNLTSYKEGHGQGLQLNTQGFSKEVVEQMVVELNDRYGFSGWVRLVKNGKPIICLPSKDYGLFYSLVKDFIQPCMSYKLPPVRGK